MITIYTLADPRNGVIFYVGATSMELKKRVSTSYRTPTAIELRELGLTHIAEEIDTCERFERAHVESYWVEQLRAWGFPLENKAYNNYRFRCGYAASVDTALEMVWREKRVKAVNALKHMIDNLLTDQDQQLTDRTFKMLGMKPAEIEKPKAGKPKKVTASERLAIYKRNYSKIEAPQQAA